MERPAPGGAWADPSATGLPWRPAAAPGPETGEDSDDVVSRLLGSFRRAKGLEVPAPPWPSAHPAAAGDDNPPPRAAAGDDDPPPRLGTAPRPLEALADGIARAGEHADGHALGRAVAADNEEEAGEHQALAELAQTPVGERSGAGRAPRQPRAVFGLGARGLDALGAAPGPAWPAAARLQRPRGDVRPATKRSMAPSAEAASDGMDALFRIRGEVLPMRLEGREPTPEEITAIWEHSWGCPFASRLKFEAPGGSDSRWLHPRNDLVALSPIIVRIEGPGAILDAVAVQLRRRFACTS